jgi:hypothetical protein
MFFRNFLTSYVSKVLVRKFFKQPKTHFFRNFNFLASMLTKLGKFKHFQKKYIENFGIFKI